MVLYYENEKVRLDLTVDSEDILNSIKTLIDEGKELQRCESGVKIKMHGDMIIDFTGNELRILF